MQTDVSEKTATTDRHPLRVGISPCPNDVYIFAALILGKIDTGGESFVFEYEDVQTLNERGASGEFDLLKISYAAYPGLRETYELLDSGGALGRGVGPLLLKNGIGAFDPTREVLVPGAATTANFLLDFFVGDQVSLTKRFLPFDALYDELRNTPGAQGVVIHEKRFTYSADGLALIQDLGEHWEENTGHPIPLGAIVARRGLDCGKLDGLVRESLLWARENRADALALCREFAKDLTDGVIESHIGLYVNEYSLSLGDDGVSAVRDFLGRIDKSDAR